MSAPMDPGATLVWAVFAGVLIGLATPILVVVGAFILLSTLLAPDPADRA